MARIEVGPGRVQFRCPGCGWLHVLNIDPEKARPRWTFNGDVERPTITPSINATVERLADPAPKRCHSFVTDGRIRFLDDCTHELAGQTVDLPAVAQRGAT